MQDHQQNNKLGKTCNKFTKLHDYFGPKYIHTPFTYLLEQAFQSKVAELNQKFALISTYYFANAVGYGVKPKTIKLVFVASCIHLKG
jgi:hypothetical protein